MTAIDIRSVIEQAAPELRARGIAALYLFGSQARGDAGADSDIDLAFDVSNEANATFSLLDQAGLQIDLAEMLGRKVDFIERKGMRPRMRDRVEREMVQLL